MCEERATQHTVFTTKLGCDNINVCSYMHALLVTLCHKDGLLQSIKCYNVSTSLCVRVCPQHLIGAILLCTCFDPVKCFLLLEINYVHLWRVVASLIIGVRNINNIITVMV